jgi:hypothetical protein
MQNLTLEFNVMRRTSSAREAKLLRLSSTRDIVDVLGGAAAVRNMIAVEGKPVAVKAVYHWISIGMFPARAMDIMKKALKKRGYTAPARLWNQIGAVKDAA